MLDAASARFQARGFAATTVADIATDAGVSQETIYKVFGGKAGLVRALYDVGTQGVGPIPAFTRSDNLRRLPDPHEVVRGWATLSMEVAPRVSPLQLLVRDAALVDPELGGLLAELDDARLARMTENARFLYDAGHLGPGLTTAAAAELMWTVTAPEVFELIVKRRGQSLEQYADFVYRAVASLLGRPRRSD